MMTINTTQDVCVLISSSSETMTSRPVLSLIHARCDVISTVFCKHDATLCVGSAGNWHTLTRKLHAKAVHTNKLRPMIRRCCVFRVGWLYNVTRDAQRSSERFRYAIESSHPYCRRRDMTPQRWRPTMNLRRSKCAALAHSQTDERRARRRTIQHRLQFHYQFCVLCPTQDFLDGVAAARPLIPFHLGICACAINMRCAHYSPTFRCRDTHINSPRIHTKDKII